jgi:hypothetical protein
MREAMEIAVGAPIEGDEGFIGEVERIDLDPSGRFAVRVAARPRHEGGNARLIPADELEPGPRGLRLHRTLAEFEEFPLADGPSR